MRSRIMGENMKKQLASGGIKEMMPTPTRSISYILKKPVWNTPVINTLYTLVSRELISEMVLPFLWSSCQP